MTEPLPRCDSMASCRRHEGRRIVAVGVYTVWDPLPDRKLDHPPARQAMLRFGSADGGEDGPFLEAWGEAAHQRPLEEIERLRGRRVRAVGTFRAHMGGEDGDAAAFDAPCLTDLTDIEALPD